MHEISLEPEYAPVIYVQAMFALTYKQKPQYHTTAFPENNIFIR